MLMLNKCIFWWWHTEIRIAIVTSELQCCFHTLFGSCRPTAGGRVTLKPRVPSWDLYSVNKAYRKWEKMHIWCIIWKSGWIIDGKRQNVIIWKYVYASWAKKRLQGSSQPEACAINIRAKNDLPVGELLKQLKLTVTIYGVIFFLNVQLKAM